MNRLILLSLLLLLIMTGGSSPVLKAQGCDHYFPCSARTLRYVTFKIQEGDLQTVSEEIEIHQVTGSNISFTRTVTMTSLKNGTISCLPRQGNITIHQDRLHFPWELFVPGRPVNTVLPFGNATISETPGSGCDVPHTMSNGPLDASTPMGMKSELTLNISDKPNVKGKQVAEWKTEYLARQVVNSNASITLNIAGTNTTFAAVIVAESVKQSGSITGTFWEISWLVKGYGRVRTYIYEDSDSLPPYDQGAGGEGYIGVRMLTNP